MRPVVGHQVVREYVYGVAAACPFDGQISSLILPYVDAETMSMFLAQVSQEFADDWNLMFLDGAGWHRAKNLRVPANVRLLPLPPYSPELNPVEHLWDHLRENYFGNETFGTLQEVSDRLCQGFRQLSAQPDLVRSLTCFDWINPLCMTSK
jgi:hypothetical protein